MNKSVLICKLCKKEIPVTINWRRDVQAHYNNNHKTNKRYISASRIKEEYFNRVEKK